jgi:ATP-binding cassette subfamily C exporter for protease/lipase
MSQKSSPSELKATLMQFRPHLMRAWAFALVAGVLVLAPTFYMFEVYDRVVNSRNHVTLLMLTLAVAWVYLVMEVLDWARAETLREVGESLDGVLGTRIFDVVFQANLKRLPGGIQPIHDLRTVREFLYSPSLAALMELPLAFIFAGLLFMLSPWLGWAAVAGGLVQALLARLNERGAQSLLSEANQAAMGAQQYADQALRGTLVVEAMGMQDNVRKGWMQQQQRFLGLQALASHVGAAFQSGAKFVQTTMGSLLLGVAAWLLLENQLPGGGGMLIVGSVLGGRMLAPLVQLIAQWRMVVGVRDAWSRLETAMFQIPLKPPSMPLPSPTGHLRVDALVAGAPNAKESILKGLNFALAPGNVMAVVGPSAAGKSTLARALVGLWPASSGSVRLDGVDVATWDKAELGPFLGYLPQDVELHDGTLAENIARFGNVDPAKLEEAARSVGLMGFVAALPQGFDTPVGPQGVLLSAGQRQRVALARAVYGNPVLVVLDEPNSSLDEVGDAALAQTIALLSARGTCFVLMTHRTGVLAVATHMLVLIDGQQQLFGPRDQVLAAFNQATQKAAQPKVTEPAKRLVNAGAAVAPAGTALV